MKKILALVLSFVLVFSLAGCGSSKKEEAKEKEKHNSQEVTYEGKFKIESIADEVTYNKDDHTDNLVVTFKVTNLSKEDATFTSVANVNVSQNDDTLAYSQLMDKDGTWIYTLDKDEKIKAGKTAELKGAWVLKDPEADVVIGFNGWGFEAGAGEMTFKVKGTESEEHAKYAKEQESILVAKKAVKKASIKGAEIKVPKGWYLDESDEERAKLVQDGLGEDGLAAYIDIEHSKSWGSAKKWSKTMNKNFGGDKKLDTVEVNGTKYIRMIVNASQFMLFTDAKDGGTIRIYGMFISYKTAKDIIKGFKVK